MPPAVSLGQRGAGGQSKARLCRISRLLVEVRFGETCVLNDRREDLGVQYLAGVARKSHTAAKRIAENPVATSLAYHLESMLLEHPLDLPRG